MLINQAESKNINRTQVDKYLRSDERLEISNHILVGSWLESMHIATLAVKDIAKSEGNAPIYMRIWNQRLHLQQIIESIEKFKDSQYFKKMLPVFNEILKICVDAKKDSDIKQEQAQLIFDKIEKIRTGIFQ